MAITNGFGPKFYPWKVSSKYGKVHSRSISDKFWVSSCPSQVSNFNVIGVRGFPYGIFDPCTPWGWGLDGLGKFVRRRRRRRRRRRPPPPILTAF